MESYIFCPTSVRGIIYELNPRQIWLVSNGWRNI